MKDKALREYLKFREYCVVPDESKLFDDLTEAVFSLNKRLLKRIESLENYLMIEWKEKTTEEIPRHVKVSGVRKKRVMK